MKQIIVDVRQPEKFKEEHIPNAINIPYNYIIEQLDKLDKNSEILLYCQDGKKSQSVETVLKIEGYNARNLGAYPLVKQGY